MFNEEDIFESLDLEVELVEMTTMGYNDTEVAALLGKSLLKKTIIQQEEIRTLNNTLEEKEQQLLKEIRNVKMMEHNNLKMFEEMESEQGREKSQIEFYISELERNKDRIERLREETEFLKLTISKIESNRRTVDFVSEAGSNLPHIHQRGVSRDVYSEKQMLRQIELEEMSKSLKCVETDRDYYKQKYYQVIEEKKQLDLKLQLQLQKDLERSNEHGEEVSESLPVKQRCDHQMLTTGLVKRNIHSLKFDDDVSPKCLEKEDEMVPSNYTVSNKESIKASKNGSITETSFGDLFRRLTECVRRWLRVKA